MKSKTGAVIYWILIFCLFSCAMMFFSASAYGAPQVSLPKDEMPHKSVQVEWWYYSGHLADAQGRNYAVMASFFIYGAGNAPRQHFAIYQLVEKDSKKFHAGSVIEKGMLAALKMMAAGLPDDLKAKLPSDMLDEATIRRYHRVMEGKPEVAKDRLSLKYGDLSFEKTKEGGDDWKTWEYSTRIKDDAFEYNLVMTPTRGPMYVGGEGNVGMHQGEDMYYYSFTRLDTKGTLKIGGEERQVSGTLWYDHQFGAMGQNNKPVGWDWFCVQLEDGTDLNISALRHPENDERFNRLATVQRADGSTVVAHDIVVEPLASWTSADTGITYPSGWLLAIPSLGMSMRVLPDFPEQEMRTFGPMRALWEGACGVTAEAGGKSIKGLGYTELVGYGFPKDLNKK